MRNNLIFLLLFLSWSLNAEDGLDRAPPLVEKQSIEVPGAESDRAIKQRLTGIFQQIEPISSVQVNVTAGVVHLTGSVPDAAAMSTAEQLAGRLDGVVYVVNELEPEVDIASRLNPTIRKAKEMGQQAVRKLPILLIALLVVFLFRILGGWLSRRRAWARIAGMNELSTSLLQRFMKLAMTVLGVFIALEILDATALAGAILGVAGIAGIALGFAFRNIVENYLAGILLSLRNPFSTGDAVGIEGVSGKVIRLTSRDTVLMTFDGNHLRIPNSKIITSTLTNYTRNPLRRFDFAIGVSVELDILKVRELAMQTLNSLESILDDPPPMIIIEELGDSTINMRFFAWIDQRRSDFLKSKSEAIRLVKVAFDEAGVEMPEPIYRVHLRGTEVLDGDQPGTDSPPRRTTPAGKPVIASDTSVDHSIDKQLKTAQSIDDEPNLLES